MNQVLEGEVNQMFDKDFSLLRWLRDPFGTKRLIARHTEVRRDMLETATRAEDTAQLVRNFPIGHMLTRRAKPKIVNPRVKESTHDRTSIS